MCIFIAGFANVAKADLSSERFGKIAIYKDATEPQSVVILFSGDKKFDSETELLAKGISKNGALVVAVSTQRYLSGVAQEDGVQRCSYLAGEITRLSQTAQNTEKLSTYRKPILMGVGSGAAFAYSLASQYPKEFEGLVTTDFCPYLSGPLNLCEGAGLKFDSSDRKKISSKSLLPLIWKDFRSASTTCPVTDTSEYFSKQKNQISVASEDLPLAQILKALKSFSEDHSHHEELLSDAVADLPLIEMFPEKRVHKSLLLIISGDGGWATIDKELGQYFQSQGYAVLGFNALKYFWKKKTPEQTAADIDRALSFYRKKMGIEDLSLLGFSLGADVLPFVVNRLSAENGAKVSLIALLSPGRSTDFEVHVGDWLGITGDRVSSDVVAEIKKMDSKNILCIYGSMDADQSCTQLDSEIIKLGVLPGDHHFNGDYKRVAQLIVDFHTDH